MKSLVIGKRGSLKIWIGLAIIVALILFSYFIIYKGLNPSTVEFTDEAAKKISERSFTDNAKLFFKGEKGIFSLISKPVSFLKDKVGEILGFGQDSTFFYNFMIGLLAGVLYGLFVALMNFRPFLAYRGGGARVKSMVQANVTGKIAIAFVWGFVYGAIMQVPVISRFVGVVSFNYLIPSTFGAFGGGSQIVFWLALLAVGFLIAILVSPRFSQFVGTESVKVLSIVILSIVVILLSIMFFDIFLKAVMLAFILGVIPFLIKKYVTMRERAASMQQINAAAQKGAGMRAFYENLMGQR